MRTFSPTTDDLFIAKKGRLSRGLARAKLPHRATHSDRSARTGELEAEQQREQREQLIRVTIADRSFETHFQPIVGSAKRSTGGGRGALPVPPAPCSGPGCVVCRRSIGRPWCRARARRPG